MQNSVNWTEPERAAWGGHTRHAAFKKSWRQPLPAREMILAEIREQLQVCENHLAALRRLLVEVDADGPEKA